MQKMHNWIIGDGILWDLVLKNSGNFVVLNEKKWSMILWNLWRFAVNW